MITYKKTAWKELKGDFMAVISDVVAEPNNYYDPSKENSTEKVLNISFELTDPDTLEVIPYVQKFVAPLTGGNSLFQQLLDVKEFLPDEDGGVFDEQDFVGMRLILTMGKNKKGYSTIENVRAIAAKQAPRKEAIKAQPKPQSEEPALPF